MWESIVQPTRVEFSSTSQVIPNEMYVFSEHFEPESFERFQDKFNKFHENSWRLYDVFFSVFLSLYAGCARIKLE